MNPMEYNVDSRKSDRANKEMQSVRFGFENYGTNHLRAVQNQLNNRAGCVIEDNQDKYSDGEQHVEKQMQPPLDRTLSTLRTIAETSDRYSIASKIQNKIIREIEYLKNEMQREAEIHQLEMEELKRKYEYERDCRKMEKQRLFKIQQTEDLRKQFEDDLNFVEEMNGFDTDEKLRETGTKELVNKFPTSKNTLKISQSWHDGDFQSIRHEEPIRMYDNNKQDDRIHDDRIQDSNYRREPIHQDAHENIQTDVLTAALNALQSREIKDLLTFDGENVLEWPNFIREFRRSTREYDIRPSKNLRRLNKALEGDAQSSVPMLLTSPESVNEILLLLKMNFGRPEWILQYLIIELRSLPVIDEENIHEFKLFYNKLFEAKLEDWFKYELDAQYADLSAKNIINKSYTAAVSDNNYNNLYIFDGKNFRS